MDLDYIMTLFNPPIIHLPSLKYHRSLQKQTLNVMKRNLNNSWIYSHFLGMNLLFFLPKALAWSCQVMSGLMRKIWLTLFEPRHTFSLYQMIQVSSCQSYLWGNILVIPHFDLFKWGFGIVWLSVDSIGQE